MKSSRLVTSTPNQSVQFKLCKVILATVFLTVSNVFAGNAFYPSSDFLGTNFNKQTNAANARTAIAATGFQDVTNIVQSIGGQTNFPYSAITNAPWVLTNDFLSSSNVLQIQINANTSSLQFKTTTNNVQGILISSNFLQSIPVLATNQFATTNQLAQATNGLPSRIWTLGNLSQSNSITSNNISGSINIGQIFGAPTTNGFVTSSITNGLATTNYVVASTNGLPPFVWTLGSLSQSNSPPLTTSLGFASGSQGAITIPAVFTGSFFFPNGANPSGTGQNQTSYGGVPLPTGTYTNLKVNVFFPGTAATTNISFTLYTNGVATGLKALLAGPLTANAKNWTNSGTTSVVVTDPNCLFTLNITNSSAAPIMGVYAGWSCDVIK